MIIILGLIGLLLMLAVVVTVFSAIVVVLLASAAVAFAGLTGVAAGLLATVAGQLAGVPEPGLVGAAVGILVFLMVAARLLRRISRKRGTVPPVQLATPAEPAEPAERDPAVREAWGRAQALVPETALAQVARARADCAVLLDMADRATFDPGVVDLAALVRRSVPALVQQVDALWCNATRAERAELAEALAEDLMRLGTAARPYADESRQSLRDGLAAIRNHVAARTGG